MATQRTDGHAAVRIGTRGSRLALVQAEQAKAKLVSAHDDLTRDDVDLVVIRTTGDRVTDRPLAEIGGKGLFAKEVEEALLAGDIDLAVHSMKDMETVLPGGLAIPCMLPREDPRDVFVSTTADTLEALPRGAVIGTSSLRRRAQLRHRHANLVVVPIRGNVETRLAKVVRGEVDATLLALAGLSRLGLADQATAILDPEDMLPAAGQGAIGIECRVGDERTQALIAPINDADTRTCITCERAALVALDGSCHTPIAAHARIDTGRLHLTARVLRPDGSEMLETRRDGAPGDAADLGRDAGAELRSRAGPDFFSES